MLNQKLKSPWMQNNSNSKWESSGGTSQNEGGKCQTSSNWGKNQMEGGSLSSQKQRAAGSLAPPLHSPFTIRRRKVTSPGEDRWRQSRRNAGWAGTAGAEGERLHLGLKRIWELGGKLPTVGIWIKEGDLSEIEKMTSLKNLERKDEDIN